MLKEYKNDPLPRIRLTKSQLSDYMKVDSKNHDEYTVHLGKCSLQDAIFVKDLLINNWDRTIKILDGKKSDEPILECDKTGDYGYMF